MSGIDEVVGDIPKCSECGYRPGFWILDIDGADAWFWLFGDGYLKGETHFSRLCIGNGIGKHTIDDLHLKDVTRVRCCGHIQEHKFFPENKTFNSVLSYAQKAVRFGVNSV